MPFNEGPLPKKNAEEFKEAFGCEDPIMLTSEETQDGATRLEYRISAGNTLIAFYRMGYSLTNCGMGEIGGLAVSPNARLWDHGKPSPSREEVYDKCFRVLIRWIEVHSRGRWSYIFGSLAQYQINKFAPFRDEGWSILGTFHNRNSDNDCCIIGKRLHPRDIVTANFW